MSKTDYHGLSGFVDHLQAHGRYTFLGSELSRDDGRSRVGLEAALRRLKKKGRIASPRRGFYVLVPLEYHVAGAPPASWFIHDLMVFLGQPYYVGLLSAAGLHGSAHQQPMVFQVVTDRPTRQITMGRNRIEFHMISTVAPTPTIEMQTETGFMRVSTAEATAFDLVRFPAAAGHLNNAATVLIELSEVMDPRALLKLAGLVRVPDVQRLGYVLDHIGEHELAEPLAKWLAQRPRRAVRLRLDSSNGSGELDRRWHVWPNETLETDL